MYCTCTHMYLYNRRQAVRQPARVHLRVRQAALRGQHLRPVRAHEQVPRLQLHTVRLPHARCFH